MSNILETICQYKKQEVKELYSSKKDILARSNAINRSSLFKSSLSQVYPAVIAEIKKASPSAGIIKKDFDAVKIASFYAQANNDAYSILTDNKFFAGSNDNLIRVRQQYPNKAILRKDFTLDPLQIYEAKAIGADAILLIVAILEKKELEDFYTLAKSIGLDVLIEVHDEQELEIALSIGCDIIGVNNRNLKDFSIDLNTSVKLAEFVPQEKVFVCESGIKTIEDVKLLSKKRCDAILVGETLVRYNQLEVKNFIEQVHLLL